MVCHSRAANFVLGLSTAQMNKEHDYGGTVEHQFRVLERLGLLKEPKNRKSDDPSATAVDPSKFPRLENPYDQAAPLEARARSYLHANCSICHMQAGGGNAQIDLEYSASLKRLNAIDVVPLHHKFDLDGRAANRPRTPGALGAVLSIGPSGGRFRPDAAACDERGG